MGLGLNSEAQGGSKVACSVSVYCIKVLFTKKKTCWILIGAGYPQISDPLNKPNTYALLFFYVINLTCFQPLVFSILQRPAGTNFLFFLITTNRTHTVGRTEQFAI